MTDRRSAPDATDESAGHSVALAIVVFLAFPGTLTAIGSGLAVALVPRPILATLTDAATTAADDPTTVLPEITAALAVATLVALVTFIRLRHP